MYLDIAVGVILLYTILRGYSNGFLLSAISLFGIVINVVLTKMATPRVIEFFSIGRDDTYYIFFYGGVFLGIYIVIGIFLAFIKSFIKNNMKNFLDTFLGVVFGLIKGLALSFMLVLFFVLGEDHIDSLKKYGKESIAKEYFQKTLPYVREYFPANLEKKMEQQRYREDVEKYLKGILKETM